MSFKYSVNFPIHGPNKISRFQAWANEHLPSIEVSLPPQVPVEAISMTARLTSLEHRALLLQKLKSHPL